MNSGFFPQVVNPRRRIQTESGGFQTPFYFGGSQVPNDLHLPKKVYSGAKGNGINKEVKSEPILSNKGRIVVKPYTLTNKNY